MESSSPSFSSSSPSPSLASGRQRLQRRLQSFLPTVDYRSLALLRIVLGLFVIHDVVCRLWFGKLSLAWYYSLEWNDDEGYPPPSWPPSILNRHDTPHTSPLHKYGWFYRWSWCWVELGGVFGSTLALALCFTCGYATSFSSVGVWWFLTCIQNQSPPLNDGSDSFLRCLLLWCALLGPELSRVWSVDHYHCCTGRRHQSLEFSESDKGKQHKESRVVLAEEAAATTPASSSSHVRQRRPKHSATVALDKHSRNSSIQDEVSFPQQLESSKSGTTITTTTTSIASAGLLWQIGFMYWGTVLHRLPGTMWLPPKFTAVYYVLNNAFATRPWATRFVNHSPLTFHLSRFMTASAMVVESSCPLLLFILTTTSARKNPTGNRISGADRFRLVVMFVLAMFHASLWACMKLPNWQLLAIIVTVVWIPSGAWNATATKFVQPQKQQSSHGKLRRALSWFFFLYMFYNWLGERQVIPKHDGGDIGEFLRCSQYWVMYGPDVRTTSVSLLVTGALVPKEGEPHNDNKYVDLFQLVQGNPWTFGSTAPVMVDETGLLEWKRTKMTQGPGPAGYFPSWRWETALYDWIVRQTKPYSITPQQRFQRLGRTLCVAAWQKHGISLSRVEFAIWGWYTKPPLVEQQNDNKDTSQASARWHEREESLDMTVVVKCPTSLFPPPSR